MRFTLNKLLLAIAGAASILAGCGGGGGGGDTPVPTPIPTPSMASVPVTVIDGAVRNATVCLDKNLNGACDGDEPSGKTDTAGNVTLQVAIADTGKYPILAVVGTDAVDADHGPVTTAFVMKAPADKPAVVSPLTTLVQTTMENTGATSAKAEAAVQAQIGLSVSLFQDFTKGTSSDSRTLGTIARMVVVTGQEQTKTVLAAVGAKAIDGSVITLTDLNKVVARRLLEVLPAVMTALSDPRVLDAGTDALMKAQALNTLAKELAASASTGLTTTTVATLVGIDKQPDTVASTGTPAASGQVVSLNYFGAQNWFRRVLTGTATQNTPDAAGTVKYVDRRSRSANGQVANWAAGSDPNRQSDLHFNGSSWVNCGLNFENVSSVRDPQGRSTYDYCDKREVGASTRAVFDVSGKKMVDVYNQVVNGGFTNLFIAGATTALGTVTFPANSKLSYQTGTPLSTAPAYYPGAGNIVRNTNSNVAAGKTTASDTSSACAAITQSTPSVSYTYVATTLESVVAANPGTPCVYGPGTTVVSTGSGTTTVASGSRNEWWSQSTISLGTLGTAPTSGNQTAYYTTNTLLRVAFGPGNTVKYYSCQQRSTDGSTRNCDPIGTGTYTITTLGDGRALTMTNPPAQTAGLTYQRVFVERGGKVYFGYQNRLTPTNSARLNLPATNALFSQLGLPAVDPNVPVALTQASYQGNWLVTGNSDTDPNGGTTILIAANSSSIFCVKTATGLSDTCTVTLTPASGAFTASFTDGTAVGTLNFVAGTGTGTFTPSSTAEPAQGFTVIRR